MQALNTLDASRKPAIEPNADKRFRQLVRDTGLDPDNPWVGGYLDYEWEHGRHIYETVDSEIAGKLFLEFGCNYGATTVVLAALGAKVVGVDVDMKALRIAHANAERYGVASQAMFVCCASGQALPFERETFDGIVCNSVLEYVPVRDLPATQKELDRVLKAGGVIFITGTSNRLAPREHHTGRWFTNYLPRWSLARPGRADALPHGVSPLQVRRGFGDYENMDWQDAGRAYLEARARMSSRSLWLIKSAHRLARLFGVSLGLLTPSLSVTLRKPARD